MDRKAYLQMQAADFILNNSDRHSQNWGFYMENKTGKLLGYVPLFDHDHAFSPNQTPELLEEEKWQALLERCRKII